MNRLIFLLLMTALSSSVTAQEKPFVAWLPNLNRPELSIEVWSDPAAQTSFIWRLVSGSNVLTEMKQPPLPDGFVVNFGECKIDGVLRNDVLAIVKHSQGIEWSENIHQLWVANVETKSFVLHTSKGTICRSEDYGI
ncbi:MAG: hypothetical protein LBP94_01315 [Zoogloeaceae bacterium]|jgi:hypothetical protein|nr:hypothetical protein [Zoogloeaceae bacterium]